MIHILVINVLLHVIFVLTMMLTHNIMLMIHMVYGMFHFFPGGSCDGKCADATDIQNLNMWGIFGRADGEPFDAKDFMKQHPEWNWQKGYLYDRPSQPWTLFD